MNRSLAEADAGQGIPVEQAISEIRANERHASARLANVPITVEILPEAQRMVDEADERWVGEHSFLTDNPLLDEILRTP